jgi:hypothetical protein
MHLVSSAIGAGERAPFKNLIQKRMTGNQKQRNEKLEEQPQNLKQEIAYYQQDQTYSRGRQPLYGRSNLESKNDCAKEDQSDLQPRNDCLIERAVNPIATT